MCIHTRVYIYIYFHSFSVHGKNCYGICQVEYHKSCKLTLPLEEAIQTWLLVLTPVLPTFLVLVPCSKLDQWRIPIKINCSSYRKRKRGRQDIFWWKVWFWVRFQWNWASIIVHYQCHEGPDSLLCPPTRGNAVLLDWVLCRVSSLCCPKVNVYGCGGS